MFPKSSRIKGGEGLLHACISSIFVYFRPVAAKKFVDDGIKSVEGDYSIQYVRASPEVFHIGAISSNVLAACHNSWLRQNVHRTSCLFNGKIHQVF